MEINPKGTVGPMVSVIVTTWNRGELVVDAIESVLEQTWTDFELIVIDDGSEDDTFERLQPYTGRILYTHQPNAGVSAARNHGAKLAKGMWLSFLDSDDVWRPSKLERQLEAVTALRGQAGACFTNCKYKGNAELTLTLFEIAGLATGSSYGIIENPHRYILSECYGLCIQSALIRREIFEKSGGFDESLVIAEDREFTFRLSFLTTFSYVAEPLVIIDRTAGVERLTDFCSQRDDSVYAWREQLLTSMLTHRAAGDEEIGGPIRDELVGLYYDWVTARIADFDVAGSMKRWRALRRSGESRRRIVATILSRAAAKFSARGKVRP